MASRTISRGIRFLLIASLAFNLGFSITWVAGQLRGVPDDALPGGMSCLNDRLGLSSEQQSRLDRSTRELLGRIGDLQTTLRREREALGDLLTAPEPDRDAVSARLDVIASLQRKVEEHLVEHLLSQKKLLTPAQRERFDEVIRGHVCPKHPSCGVDCAEEGVEARESDPDESGE